MERGERASASGFGERAAAGLSWVEKRPLQCLGSMWASCMAGYWYYQRNSTLQTWQKVVQGRMYAQVRAYSFSTSGIVFTLHGPSRFFAHLQALIVGTLLTCAGVSGARTLIKEKPRVEVDD